MRIIGIVLLVAGASVGCSGGLAEEVRNEARNEVLAEEVRNDFLAECSTGQLRSTCGSLFDCMAETLSLRELLDTEFRYEGNNLVFRGESSSRVTDVLVSCLLSG